jgi:hypothetical protein
MKYHIILYLIAACLSSCGANLTIDNKTKAADAQGGTWDVEIVISDQDFGVVKSGKSAGPKNIGNNWETQKFIIKNYFLDGQNLLENQTWQEAMAQKADTVQKYLNGYIDSGEWTWYIGLGTEANLKAKTKQE